MALRTVSAMGAALILCCSAARAGESPADAPAAVPAADGDKAQGYLSAGLVVASSRFTTPLVPTVEASGGGLGFHGAGHSTKVSPSLDIAFTGQVALMQRTFDGSNEEVGDFLYEVDGGLRISRIFYASLGVHSQTTAHENPDLATTYKIVPLSAGILLTSDSGYVLAQARLGAGRLGNDQNDDTERINYAGLRGVVQHGFANGVQFMLGLGWDRYAERDGYAADEYARLEAGIGFGL